MFLYNWVGYGGYNLVGSIWYTLGYNLVGKIWYTLVGYNLVGYNWFGYNLVGYGGYNIVGYCVGQTLFAWLITLG